LSANYEFISHCKKAAGFEFMMSGDRTLIHCFFITSTNCRHPDAQMVMLFKFLTIPQLSPDILGAGDPVPVFLCRRELKKFASTPSPLPVTPGLLPSIC
jgi:hypothetical protein